MYCKQVWERRSHALPFHHTPEKALQLDQVRRSRWRLQVSVSHPELVLNLFEQYFIKMCPAPIEDLAQVPTVLTFEAV